MSHILFFLIISALLAFGWVTREESFLSPEDGIGYYLGIIGGSMMLLLALYSFRKKYRFMRNWGPIRYWFSSHMMMGVMGPVLILFHSNFALGSTNSTLAMLSMLIVASSGLVGRYFYKKIHHGLYGRHASLNELKEMVKLNKGRIGKNLKLRTKSVERLARFEKLSLRDTSILMSILRLPFVTLLSHFVFWIVGRELKLILKRYRNKNAIDKATYKKARKMARQQLKVYVSSVSQLSGFTAYVKLFSIWHHLHLPLFIILILTGIVHVVVVHVY